jgi:hypothetical protein
MKMPFPDRDIAAAATLLMVRYRSNAKTRAFHRAANLAALGEFSAHRVWIEVVRAIDHLQQERAPTPISHGRKKFRQPGA